MKFRSQVFLLGGLGNQLFQYSFALFLKSNGMDVDVFYDLQNVRISKNLKPDISQFLEQGPIEPKPHNIDSLITKKLMNLLLRFSTARGIVPTKLIKLINRIILTFINTASGEAINLVSFSNPGYVNNLDISKPKKYLGYFQTYRWGSIPNVKEQLRNLISNQNSDLIKTFEVLSIKHRPLVVHLRIGDYLSNPKIGTLSGDYYVNAVRELWDTGLYGEVWAFSDSIDLAMKKLAPLGNLPIRWIAPIHAEPGEILGIMTLGCGYVISNSTFGWWGAFLSRDEKASVIAPNKWFKKMRDPLDLCPPGWKRAPSAFG